MGSAIFMLILWPVVIFIAYKFIALNISHTEEKEK